MAEYSSLKVPELKKLLAEKKLPQTGNKADLIARLQEDDKKNASGDAGAQPGELHSRRQPLPNPALQFARGAFILVSSPDLATAS